MRLHVALIWMAYTKSLCPSEFNQMANRKKNDTPFQPPQTKEEELQEYINKARDEVRLEKLAEEITGKRKREDSLEEQAAEVVEQVMDEIRLEARERAVREELRQIRKAQMEKDMERLQERERELFQHPLNEKSSAGEETNPPETISEEKESIPQAPAVARGLNKPEIHPEQKQLEPVNQKPSSYESKGLFASLRELLSGFVNSIQKAINNLAGVKSPSQRLLELQEKKSAIERSIKQTQEIKQQIKETISDFKARKADREQHLKERSEEMREYKRSGPK
ncbi:hypothetical protein [Legionella jordanis]|nr:hypothetical protein [Legionella jordanis]